MAKKNKSQNLSHEDKRAYNLGMVKDLNASFLPNGSWASARNANNNSQEGDLGVIGNEPSNALCVSINYTIIGKIKLYDDKWLLFSTDNSASEIAIFDESACTYEPIVNDTCLGFKTTHLITGESKENFDCSYQAYWADNLNPDRTLNISNIPYKGQYQPIPSNPSCVEFIEDFPKRLDCEQIRLIPLTKQPCFTVKKATLGGQLFNGSYSVTGAYTLNGQVVSDYFSVSNVQPIFEHENVAGSIDITVNNMEDESYDEFKLVVIAVVNSQTKAYDLGIYSTREKYIYIDYLDQALPSVPLDTIMIRTPNYDRSESIHRNGEYLMRVAPSAKFDFNYQPTANNIVTKWSCVEYPADYYNKGGSNPSFLRDEVYALFIRFVYNTGEKSSSYHIPGRNPNATDTQTINDSNTIEGANTPRWKVYNTATFTLLTPTQVDTNGYEIAEGLMGYWESTEKYQDNKPDVWGNLCGKNIRHHKFPDTTTDGVLSTRCNHFDQQGTPGTPFSTERVIRIMGVKFSNIEYPKDNQGVPIDGIVGYEILRGSREGNKSIIAKGMFNNMIGYVLPEHEDKDNVPANTAQLNADYPKKGLYQNYPFNDLRPDPFIYKKLERLNGRNVPQYAYANNLVNWDYLSFHSPDTQFRNPFLSAQELKLYGALRGTATGRFKEPEGHPMHKIITDFSFIVAAIGGIGIAAAALAPEVRSHYGTNWVSDTKLDSNILGTGGGFAPAFWGMGTGGSIGGWGFAADILSTSGALQIADLISAGFSTTALTTTYDILAILAGITTGSTPEYTLEMTAAGKSGLNPIIRALQYLPAIALYWSQGTDEMLRLIRNLIRFEQYALAYESHCEYDQLIDLGLSGVRRKVKNSRYIKDGFQDYDLKTKINNLYRGHYVCVNTEQSIPSGHPQVNYDNTRNTLGTIRNGADLKGTFGSATVANSPYAPQVSYNEPTKWFNTQSQCYYGALKVFIDNQYGQLNNRIKQIPIGCIQPILNLSTRFESGIIFGGDTYITRYTEKNTMFYFYEWLNGQPDDYEFNYDNYLNVPRPLYWVDTREYDASTFLSGILKKIGKKEATSDYGILPNDYHYLDRKFETSIIEGQIKDTGGDNSYQRRSLFRIIDAYFYLFNSGVRDFYVESEVNTDLRDWNDTPEERHYDPYRYTSLRDLFNTDIIKSGNLFKYDYSLSISRNFRNLSSWGNMQLRSYDPQVSETCYSYYPKRVIYSLPQNKELIADNWRAWLVNNYKDFSSRITTIKPIGRNGAMMLFEQEAPIMIPGVDVLETDAGTKITIGDGGLFSQPLQNIVNTDKAYEYGSCQNKESVVNTPFGLFYISLNQGKIFRYAGGLDEISRNGMQWWFSNHLPYKILEDFPEFELTDNSVIGVGAQCIYDNSDKIIYVCKKDYKLKSPKEANYRTIEYLYDNWFQVDKVIRVSLGDPRYFDDASWTVSFDPKAGNGQGAWVSFHDWHPTMNIASKTTFMTVNRNSIWKHNDRCDSFCNFYGVDYPFEIETIFSTQDQATVLRSAEYTLECYKIASDCIDWHHKLDENFDEAIIYNTEQISGILRLNLAPKNDVNAILQYPAITPNYIDILFAKEENKYRFNQFWDITLDRGEYSGNTRIMWETDPNGYTKNINPFYIDYNKPELQRKKFRHYLSSLILKKRVSGDSKFLFKLNKEKQVISPR